MKVLIALLTVFSVHTASASLQQILTLALTKANDLAMEDQQKCFNNASTTVGYNICVIEARDKLVANTARISGRLLGRFDDLIADELVKEEAAWAKFAEARCDLTTASTPDNVSMHSYVTGLCMNKMIHQRNADLIKLYDQLDVEDKL